MHALSGFSVSWCEGKAWKLFYFAFGMHWQKWAVRKHSTQESLWIIIHGDIFDVTDFEEVSRVIDASQFASLRCESSPVRVDDPPAPDAAERTRCAARASLRGWLSRIQAGWQQPNWHAHSCSVPARGGASRVLSGGRSCCTGVGCSSRCNQ